MEKPVDNTNKNPKNGFSKNIKGGYDLPDAYFAEMKANVMVKIGQSEVVGWRQTWKSVFGFAAGFAVMVLFAVGVVNLTPKEIIEKTQNGTAYNENDELAMEQFMIVESLSEDDVLDYIFEINDNTSDKKIAASIAYEYVELYGGIDNF